MKIYMVGGAVRDLLMGKKPNDIDYVVVGSTEQEMLNLGYSQVGVSFPVFLHPVTKEEYALARTEKKTGIGYGGFSVETENVTLEDDLRRRDLTINSLAIDKDLFEKSTLSIIDPFGGQNDIKNKILRHTSEAFSEDPLRVIRLARFAARYPDFSIAPETFSLAWEIVASEELDALPNERFWTEITKAKTENWWKFFDVLEDLGCFAKIRFFRELFKHATRDDVIRAACAANHVQHSEAVLVALTSNAAALAQLGASTEMIRLQSNLQRFREADSVNALYEFLKGLRAWNTLSDYRVFCQAHLAACSTGEQFKFSLEQLTLAVDAVRKITAGQLDQSLKGADIGRELERLRINSLQRIINGAGRKRNC